MKRLLFVPLIAGQLLLSACDDDVPDCADADTQELVQELLFKVTNDPKDQDAIKQAKEKIKVQINTIQTLAQTEKPKKFTCQANVKLSLSEDLVKSNTLIGTPNDIFNQSFAPALLAGLQASQVDKQTQPLMLAMLTPLSLEIQNYGPDLRDFVTTVKYTSEQVQQDGKARHYVNAQFAHTPNIADMVFVNGLIHQGENYLKTHPAQPAKAPVNETPIAPQPQAAPVATTAAIPQSTPSVPAQNSSSTVPPVVSQNSGPSNTQAVTPSFDCQKASSLVETLICTHPDLAAADQQLAQLYRHAKSTRDPNLLRKEQVAWLKRRNDCTTLPCVESAYQERISALK